MFLKYFLLCGTLLAFLFNNAGAQDSDSAAVNSTGTFVAMPLINNNPVMKTSLGGIGMYMFSINKTDTISPSSTVMLLGLYSTNKSYVLFVPTGLFFENDFYRITAMGSTNRINNSFDYNIEGNDVTLVYSEIRWMYIAEFSVQALKKFFAGFIFAGFLTNYKYDQGSEAENSFTRALFNELGIKNNFTSSLGIKLSYDTRDYIYNASSGIQFTVRSLFFTKWLGSENEYTTLVYDFKYYHSLTEKHVLAGMFSGGNSFGEVPFSGYQMYGMRSSLRGYPTGKYRGENMTALQAEYRWNFYKRWGLVGFAGVGTVWGGENQKTEEVFEKQLLPGWGIGVRFMLSEERKINARMDYAWGIDGNQGIYLSIMEAF